MLFGAIRSHTEHLSFKEREKDKNAQGRHNIEMLVRAQITKACLREEHYGAPVFDRKEQECNAAPKRVSAS